MSRALCPTAKIARRQGMVFSPAAVRTVSAARAPSRTVMSVTRQPKRTSPPCARISARSPLTARRRRSVPTCGFACHKMSGQSPARASSVSTKRQRASLMPVLSLPSENAPAPPSPNCTLQEGSSVPSAHSRSTAARRVSTSCPRSSSSGRAPARASTSAANSPAGPPPTTTGRSVSLMGATAGTYTVGGAITFASRQRAAAAASSPRTVTSSVALKQTASFLRASTARLNSVQVSTRSGGRRSARAAMSESCAAR